MKGAGAEGTKTAKNPRTTQERGYGVCWDSSAFGLRMDRKEKRGSLRAGVPALYDARQAGESAEVIDFAGEAMLSYGRGVEQSGSSSGS